MDEYYSVVNALPPTLSDELHRLDAIIAPAVQEIRLRAGQPAYFTIRGKLVPCTRYLPAAKHCASVGQDLLQDCFLQLCRYSAYAYEEELGQGFLTIRGEIL